ncbi:hypothetical protein [Cytobacillus sp. IB215665]|uniref:hypothetical protein n=1 Tax=Cytobacillus sp. IB215665 TaxID=3097357 RepID=UPI002A12F309|nr:hypothetical protein [Cytobacillus sp. IB215665]MDX8364320.1 hypothetical protein [Cytobacillus sp. IB215665]
MKKNIICIFLIGILVGCSEQTVTEENWEVSPTFTIKSGDRERELRGYKSEVAFLDTMDFLVDKAGKTRWFFWGEELEEVNEEHFKLIGIHKNTGEEKTLIDSKGWEVVSQNYKETGIKGVLGAQSSQHTMFTLPTAGLWRLNAYISDKLYGSIVVEVEE